MGKGMLNCFDIEVYDLVTSTIETLPYLYPWSDSLIIFGTAITIEMMYWRREFEVHYPDIELREVAAPEFVPLLEMREPDEKALSMYLRRRIGPHFNDGHRQVLLACTHFAFLTDLMEELFPGILFIDPAVCLANKARNSLELPDPEAGGGTRRFFLTRESERFVDVASEFLGYDARPHIEYVRLDEPRTV
jgi:glutamate racemase